MVDFQDSKSLINLTEQCITATSPKKTQEERSWIKTGCIVHWIEWSGSRRYGVATLCQQENCTVEYNGRCNYLVTLPNSQKIVHRSGTHGFKVIGGILV